MFMVHSSAGGETVYDAAVVGGGVVGLAVAQSLAVRGASVAVLEREDSVINAASSGNSGLGCTGYDAPVGSLEQQLLRRAISLHPPLMRAFGLSYAHVRKSGSLVVAWTPEQLKQLSAVLEENVDAGDEEVKMLTASELQDLVARGAFAWWRPWWRRWRRWSTRY